MTASKGIRRRKPRHYTDAETAAIKVAANQLGCADQVIYNRLARRWSWDEALSLPKGATRG